MFRLYSYKNIILGSFSKYKLWRRKVHEEKPILAEYFSEFLIFTPHAISFLGLFFSLLLVYFMSVIQILSIKIPCTFLCSGYVLLHLYILVYLTGFEKFRHWEQLRNQCLIIELRHAKSIYDKLTITLLTKWILISMSKM